MSKLTKNKTNKRKSQSVKGVCLRCWLCAYFKKNEKIFNSKVPIYELEIPDTDIHLKVFFNGKVEGFAFEIPNDRPINVRNRMQVVFRDLFIK